MVLTPLSSGYNSFTFEFGNAVSPRKDIGICFDGIIAIIIDGETKY